MNDNPELRHPAPESSSNQPETRRKRVLRYVLTAAWIANVAVLLAAFWWVYFEPRSLQTMQSFQKPLASVPTLLSFEKIKSIATSRPMVGIVAIAAVTAMITVIAMALGTMMGGRRFRTLRMWLAFTAIFAGWLTFLVAWQDVYWHGQQRRMRPVLRHAETMARFLEMSWPEDDGELTGIGPFLAYPKGKPTTIMPLKWVTIPNTLLRFSTVERTDPNVIGFELTGDEAGAWLEWRGDDHAPEAFKSGLDTRYNVGRYTRLAPHWFLVRYTYAGVGG